MGHLRVVVGPTTADRDLGVIPTVGVAPVGRNVRRNGRAPRFLGVVVLGLYTY